MSKKNGEFTWCEGIRMTKNRKRALSATIDDIQGVIKMSDKLKNAYFWTPGGNVASRRAQEKRYQAEASWSEGGHQYEAHIWCSMSSRNVYVYREYTKDGIVTNLTAIKSSLKRLEKLYTDAVERAEKRK